MKKILFLLLLSSISAYAQVPDKASFCEIRQDRNKLVNMLKRPGNLLTLVNQQGLLGLNTGVCWWHSRLQRRFSYLADFRPREARPSEKEVKKILREIKRGNQVVKIPGYNNLAEFSNENADLIQKSLNAWIFGDSLLRQKWVKGLQGKSSFKIGKLSTHLKKMNQEFVESDGIMMQVLQMKGVVAHAWLVIDMKESSKGFFELDIVDSNLPDNVVKYEIWENDPSMDALYLYGDFIGYTQFRAELKKIKEAVNKYCSDQKIDRDIKIENMDLD